MHPGGYNPRPGTAPTPTGAYGNSQGVAGFRNGGNRASAPPYRQPPPPAQQQMTPQWREEVLLEAGRLAAEHLVAIGELPPHVLQRGPPAPLPFFHEGPSAALPRPRPFQERPLARHHFQFHPPASRGFGRPFAPRPFQGIAKRPRPFQASRLGRFQGRPPFHSGVRGPAAAPVGSLAQVALNDAPAGDGNANVNDGQPVTQSGDAVQSPKNQH